MNIKQTAEKNTTSSKNLVNRSSETIDLLNKIINRQKENNVLLSSIYKKLKKLSSSTNNTKSNEIKEEKIDNDDDNQTLRFFMIQPKEDIIIKRPRNEHRVALRINKTIVIQNLVPYTTVTNISYEDYNHLYLEDLHKITVCPFKNIGPSRWKKASILYLTVFKTASFVVDELQRLDPTLIKVYSNITLKQKSKLIHTLEKRCRACRIPLHLAEDHWLANHFISTKYGYQCRLRLLSPNRKIIPHKRMYKKLFQYKRG